jgi:GTP-binding protein
MFVDEVKISVRGGKGGNGCVSFRREKFVPRGGPDGGRGGRGGNVVFYSDPNVNTLIAFRYKKHFFADRGKHGQGKSKTGASGEDYRIAVPLGTQIYTRSDRQLLCDLQKPGQEFIAARGGKGGRGNESFVSSTRQAPRIAEPGQDGEERELTLELKLIADVGLVGFPNAGKSSLLSRLSAAKPKIADYPFTTLNPYLGMVELRDYTGFVVADIPGIIEKAHEGAGLGIRFLKHIERTKMLLYVIDGSPATGRTPMEEVVVLREEIRQFNPEMLSRPAAVALNKVDLLNNSSKRNIVRRQCEETGMTVFLTSAVTGEGLEALKHGLASILRGGDDRGEGE